MPRRSGPGPFLHFFDGFRTSHEINRIAVTRRDDIRALVREDDVLASATRGLTPDAPVVRGTAQNPDVFFQAARPRTRSTWRCRYRPGRHGRVRGANRPRYGLVDYHGAPDAERVIVVMGSASGAVEETVGTVAAGRGGHGPDAPVPAVPVEDIVAALPKMGGPSPSSTGPRSRAPAASRSTWRTSSPSPRHGPGRAAIRRRPRVIGGRYGLSSKGHPSMVKPISTS